MPKNNSKKKETNTTVKMPESDYEKLGTTESARDQLSLAGAFLPLLVCNVGYRTRNSLLMYAALGCIISAALEINSPPEENHCNLVDFCEAVGINKPLLHDLGSTPLIMGNQNGLWMLQTKAHDKWKKNNSSSPPAGHSSQKAIMEWKAEAFAIEPTSSTISTLIKSQATLGKAKNALTNLGKSKDLPQILIIHMHSIVSALWPYSHVKDFAIPHNLPRNHSLENIKNKELAVCLLCTVPAGIFEATPHAIRAAATLANPVYQPGHEFLESVVNALRLMGLTRDLLQDVYDIIVFSPHSRANSSFVQKFTELHHKIRNAVSPKQDVHLQIIFKNLHKLSEETTRKRGYVFDQDNHHKHNPNSHLIEALTTLAKILDDGFSHLHPNPRAHIQVAGR
jgi:hypothetical protein